MKKQISEVETSITAFNTESAKLRLPDSQKDDEDIDAILTQLAKVTFAGANGTTPAVFKDKPEKLKLLGGFCQARFRLDESLKLLDDYTQLSGYMGLSKETKDRVTVTQNNAKAKLDSDTFREKLGTAAKPGTAVKALLEYFKEAAPGVANEKVFGKSLATDPVPAELLEKLKDGLPGLKAALDKVTVLQAEGAHVILLLPRGPIVEEYTARVKALGERRDAIAKALPGWLKGVTETVNSRALTVMRRANDVRRRKPGANAFAIVESDGARKLIADIEALEKAADSARNGAGLSGTIPNDVVLANQALAVARQDLADNLGMVTGLLQNGIEESELITQEVRLSYFPDVSRLVKILNPNAQLVDPTKGVADGVAVAKFVELRQLEANIREGRANVEEIKTRLQRIDFQVQAARAARVRATDLLTRALGQQQGMVDARTKLEKQLSTTTDENRKLQLQTQIDGIKEKEEVQAKAVEAVQADKKSADDTYDTLLNEEKGLPKKRLEAEEALKKEEEALSALRKNYPLLAQQESDAFASARDNAPYFSADPIPDDPDPVRRVYLYADSNSRVLYIRGRRDDVAVARETVAEFDKPAPQTKLTFYTLQLNGTDESFGLGTAKARRNDPAKAEVFDTIEENLSAVRSGTDLVVDSLRQAVAEVVFERSKDSDLTPRLARYAFYSPHVLQALGFPRGQVAADVSVTALTRYTLPDPARLTTLGEILFVLSLSDTTARNDVRNKFNEKIIRELLRTDASDLKSSSKSLESLNFLHPISAPKVTRKPFVLNLLTSVLRATVDTAQPIPALKNQVESAKKKLDAAKATYITINATDATDEKKQAANIAVTEAESWVKIAETQNAVASWLTTLALPNSSDNSANKKGQKIDLVETVMDSLSIILGLPTRRHPTLPDITQINRNEFPPAQKEVLDALTTKARTDVAGTVYNILRQLDAMPEELRYSSRLAESLREQYVPLIGWLSHDPSRELPARSSNDAWTEAGQNILKLTTPPDGSETIAGGLQNQDRIAFEIVRHHYVSNPLSKATGRIEAADLMIRGMIDAFDDDLKRLVRIPAMKAIRQEIATKLKGVSFGGIEETSFLATNRRVARVDPVSSAGLTVDEKAEMSEAAVNLSQLLMKQKEREGVRDALLGSALNTAAVASREASTNTAANIGIVSLLSSLFGTPNADPQTAASQTYSISSGNLYKITPIFGPSGQGMRFNFDFVGTTKLREPYGVTNPLVPRIDRHTINTEVGLSNLEMRQITSFDTNYQLGMPKQRSGGMPLLNMLPGVKDIPIVGYFSMRSRQDPVRQKSIILAQSVLYPTVGDVVGLMMDSAVAPVTFSPEPPSQSRKLSEISPFKPDGMKRVPLVNYRPNQTFTVEIKLTRPVRTESSMTLDLVGSKELETIGDSTVRLARGQDSAIFLLKRREFQTADLNDISRDWVENYIQKLNDSTKRNELKGNLALIFSQTDDASLKRKEAYKNVLDFLNGKTNSSINTGMPLLGKNTIVARINDVYKGSSSHSYTIEQDYTGMLIQEGDIDISKDVVSLKADETVTIDPILKEALKVPIFASIDDPNVVLDSPEKELLIVPSSLRSFADANSALSATDDAKSALAETAKTKDSLADLALTKAFAMQANLNSASSAGPFPITDILIDAAMKAISNAEEAVMTANKAKSALAAVEMAAATLAKASRVPIPIKAKPGAKPGSHPVKIRFSTPYNSIEKTFNVNILQADYVLKASHFNWDLITKDKVVILKEAPVTSYSLPDAGDDYTLRIRFNQEQDIKFDVRAKIAGRPEEITGTGQNGQPALLQLGKFTSDDQKPITITFTIRGDGIVLPPRVITIQLQPAASPSP